MIINLIAVFLIIDFIFAILFWYLIKKDLKDSDPYLGKSLVAQNSYFGDWFHGQKNIKE